MPASIFAGSKVKALKNTLSLNGGADIISSTTDPTSSAVDAVPGSLLLNTSTGKMYRKNDSGSSTNWTEVGSGGGGINYILNPSADSGVTGWATYADAAGAAPVDGTGGSANITWATTSSNPLRGSTGFLLTKDAANRQGQGVSYDFTIDRADTTGGIGPAVQQVSFDYQITSAAGTYGYGTSSTNSDLTIYIYDVTNLQVIQPAGYKIDGGRVRATFQPNSSSRSYRLILHVATASTTAWTMQIDNVQVGPQVRSYGPAMSDWQAYTPTFSGFGTATSIEFYWRRVGDSAEILGKFTTGTATASEGRVGLPNGLTVDGVKVASIRAVGVLTRGANSTTTIWSMLAEPSVTYLTFGAYSAGTAVGSSPLTKQNGNNLGNSETETVRAVVPIAGWSSNTLVSDSADTRVVAARATTSASTSIADATFTDVVVNTVTYDTHGGFNTSTGVYTVKVPGKYRISGSAAISYSGAGLINTSIYINGARYSDGNSGCSTNGSVISGAPVATEADLKVGDTVQLRIYQITGGARNLSATASQNRLEISLASGPSQIAASEVIAARILKTVDQTGLNNTDVVVSYGSKTVDTHNAWDTTNNYYKCPAAGLYRVTAQASFSSVLSGLFARMRVRKNSTTTLESYTYANASMPDFTVSVTDLIQCAAGDLIDVTGGSSDPSFTIAGGTTIPWGMVSIERIGGVM